MATLRSAPQSRTQYAWPLPGDARAVASARADARKALEGLGLDAEAVDDAVLMVSEIVTNALLYGDPPYEMTVRADPAEIVCAVVDSGRPLPAPRSPGSGDERGRGLHIVAILSDGFYGCHPQRYLAWPARLGKATWFALPRGTEAA
ncbi:MAG TPA: ATP-binding protein [Nonomuraea sp.]|uniref:ATP-binding protein n=1 Tax=Nonomuraea sp. NPDC049649 TaxID=3155776 RepID=UPI002BB09C0B|nr:ATP-binding protein [Nonomuraea sp.]